ncbi:12050_t:CDS:1, partial [Cetraspora pellucida]
KLKADRYRKTTDTWQKRDYSVGNSYINNNNKSNLESKSVLSSNEKILSQEYEENLETMVNEEILSQENEENLKTMVNAEVESNTISTPVSQDTSTRDTAIKEKEQIMAEGLMNEIKNRSEVEYEFTIVSYKKNKTKKLTKAAAA